MKPADSPPAFPPASACGIHPHLGSATSRTFRQRCRRGVRALARLLITPDTWALLAIAALWLYLFPYSAALNNPNERTRLMQAWTLAEQGSLCIGQAHLDGRGRKSYTDLFEQRHFGYFVNDMALVCDDPTADHPHCAGKLYPAKAPGTALLGVPGLSIAAAFGWLDYAPQYEARATWMARYTGVALPTWLGLMMLAWLLARAGVAPTLRAKVLLATGLGTAVFPYAIMFVGHALAGAVLLIGAAFTERARLSRAPVPWALVGGAVAAFAVLLEYHTAILVMAIATWVLVDSQRARVFPAFATGAAAMAILHITLHQAAFGSGLKTGHFFLLSEHNRASQASGFLGIDGFRFQAFADVLWDPYMGLIPIMAWLVYGAWFGIPQLWRHQVPNFSKGFSRLLVVIPLLYLFFVASLAQWRNMNGWSIGPRYLVPVLIPAALVAGIGWHTLLRHRPVHGWIMTGLAAASIVIVSAVTMVYPQPPDSVANPFVDLAVPLLSEGYGVRNLGLALGLGTASLKPALIGVAVIALWVVLAWRGLVPSFKKALVATLVAALVATAWVAGMYRWPHTTDKNQLQWSRDFVISSGEGTNPQQPPTMFPPLPP